MRQYNLGDPVALRRVITDDEGAPVLGAGTFTFIRPDGTQGQGTVYPSTAGLDVTLSPQDVDQAGRYEFAWHVTSPFLDEATGTFYLASDGDEVPPLASFAALARKLGYEPEETERDRAEHLLDEASELIRDKAGATWLVPGTNALDSVPRRVARICVAAAYRAFTNPEGLSQRSIGDSSKSYDRTGREGGEDVYLTEEEERAVRKAAGGSTFVAVTLVSPYSADAGRDTWAEVTAE